MRRNRKQSLSDYAYEVLLDKILFLELAPKSFVDVRGLAKDLKISITPLNTALRRLEKIRLVKIIPRKGVLVAPIDMEELLSIFELRLILFAFSGRMAAQRISSGKLKEIEEIYLCMDEIAEQPDSNDIDRRFFKLEKEFHDLLDESTGNGILKEANDLCYCQCFRLHFLFKADFAPKKRICQEWMEILKSLRSRDPEIAEIKCRQHVLNSIETVKKLFSDINERTKEWRQ